MNTMCLFCTRKNYILCNSCKMYLNVRSEKELRKGIDNLLAQIEFTKIRMPEWFVPFSYRLKDLYQEADLLIKYLTRHLAETTKKGQES